MADCRLLAIFAHPDDETYRSGGTLALLARQGVGVCIFTATRGEAGLRGEPPVCAPEDRLGVREKELRCACTALGLEPPRVLGYRDGHLAEADPEQIIVRLCAIVRELRPQVMLSFGLDGLSGHPDHIAIGRCAAEAYAREAGVAALYALAVPCSLAEQLGMLGIHPVPDETIALRVDVTSVWQAKRAAMDCHATQRSATPMLRAPEDQQRMFFGREYFVRVARRRPDQDFMMDILKEHCL
ncbi:MAG: PIG-L family deacetylase [Chloroflexi bacterium]|nr:PIG-L family deacetylase [Chloroflexota bacterium]